MRPSKDLLFFLLLFCVAGFLLYYHKLDGKEQLEKKFPKVFANGKTAGPIGYQKPRDKRPDNGPLALILQSSVHQHVLNQAVPVIVILQNPSREIMLVFRNFNLVSPIDYEALDSQNRKIERRPHAEYDFSAEKDFYWLRPGEMIQGVIDLNQYFKFTAPGNYQVRALYKGFKHSPPRSNPVFFELIRP